MAKVRFYGVAACKHLLLNAKFRVSGKRRRLTSKGASPTSSSVLRDLGLDIQWVHSYVTDDKIYGIYRAESADKIREHAVKGGFPANSISLVRSAIDPTTVG